MQREAFETRIRELEVKAQANPAAYRLRVLAFALVGYGVYALLIAISLGLLAGTVVVFVYKPSFWTVKLGIKLGIPVLLFVYVLLAALRIQLPLPQGIALKPSDSPALFDAINDIARRLKVGKLDGVLATDSYNASVVQLPRFGLFGKQSYLLLGVPLLQALSVEDVKAVLAHELGHLSGNHGRFAGWVYQMVRIFEQVLERSGSNKVLEKFLGWYVPRLDALSFPLRRTNEYEADAAAAEIVGKQRAGQALTNVHVRGAAEEPFWTAIKRQVHETPHPPATLFVNWAERVQSLAPTQMEQALAEACSEETGLADTHPSLSDRLEALGVSPRLEAPPEQSAAEVLLAPSYEYFVQQAGYFWSAQVHEGWKAEHDRLQQSRSRLLQLEQERQARGLDEDESFEYSELCEDLRPEQDALPLYEAVARLYPEHLGARFSVARLLLARDDERGVALMRALEQEPVARLRLVASALLAGYFERRGEQAAAEHSREQAERVHGELLQRARARDEIRSDDRFVPHALPEEELARLVEDLKLFPEIKRAYLVQKAVAAEEAALFVLGVAVTALGAMKATGGDLSNRIVSTVSLPGETWVLTLDDNPKFRGPLKKIANSLVYEAS